MTPIDADLSYIDREHKVVLRERDATNERQKADYCHKTDSETRML